MAEGMRGSVWGVAGWLGVVVGLGGCQAPAGPPAIPLVDRFAEATVEASPPPVEVAARLAWSFAEGTAPEGVGEEGDGQLGWRALNDLSGLAVRDGRLAGRTGATPLLVASMPEDLDPSDAFFAFEIRLRASAGGRLGLDLVTAKELDVERVVGDAAKEPFHDFNIDLRPGEKLETYTLDAGNARFSTSYALSSIRHLVLRPTDAEGAEVEIESARLVTLKEHLAGIASGVGWQGLGDVFRETIVARAPERVTFVVDLPARPFLDLTIGTVEQGPVTFEVTADDGGEPRSLLRRTLSTPGRWHEVPLDLGDLAGREARITLALDAEKPGAIGYWGSPVIRDHGARPPAGEPAAAVAALGEGAARPPRGVILIVADTLRRDSFQPYGHPRDNAPVVTALARDGVLFRDAIAQGTWTKVSVTSILTSLYPPTHGVRDMPDRMPAGVTTLAEAYRAAGYATFATSSVPFTGRLTNLHQGVEVLHESSSVDVDHSSSKTARTYVDRLTEWIEARHDVPFFAFLHVFDPHSPFEPYNPYQSLFLTPEERAEFRQMMETVKEHIEEPFMRRQALPRQAEIERSGVDIAKYLEYEKAWYDASIKAMDVEIGRLLERLEALGLADDVLIAFVADHGEEFLEHGRHFHGYHAYGEMVNVPLILSWPRGLPAGLEVEPTVQAIDLMPTLLELSRLPVPAGVQGQSLLPLVAADPSGLGWRPQPAFSERAPAPVANPEEKDPRHQISLVDGRWKLVRNLAPEEAPDLELFDHREDPLNLTDVAAEHPEVVERLAPILDGWYRAAQEAKLEAAEAGEMSDEDLKRLRALGYID